MKKKRLFALLMAGAMAVSMTACGGGDKPAASGGAASGAASSGAAAGGEGGNYAIVVKSMADQY